MESKKISSRLNPKEPSYVKIYEKMYDDVINGVYKAGEQLPPEAKLAEIYQVSRNTLRQAISILCEDGLVYNVQGKGNFVSQNYTEIPLGFEKLNNPIFTSTKIKCDEVRLDYNFAPPAKVVQEKMNISSSELTLTSNIVYYSCEKPISHAFMEIPVKFITEMGVDLNDENSVQDLLNQKIFDAAATSAARVTYSVTGESISEYLSVQEGAPVIFIEEVLYTHTGEAIALCKYYLLPENYSIRIIRKK